MEILPITLLNKKQLGDNVPYIDQKSREKFEIPLFNIPEITTKGELEYCISKLMNEYMRLRAPTYSNLHDTVYAAQHCADEFRRRFLDSREDYVKGINGDVFGQHLTEELK